MTDENYYVARAERADDELSEAESSLPTPEESADEREKVDEYCEEIRKSLADYADGLTSTREETACARKLRDELSPDAVTRMEAFRTPPYAGRNCFALFAVTYFFAALFYFVSFGGSRADGIILVFVALGIFVLGGIASGAAFLGVKKAVACLYPKKISYNVYSENMPLKEQKGNNLVIIASNHDASPGSYFVNFERVRKVVFVVAPVSAVLFVLFCIVKICVGSDTVPKITSLSILPFFDVLAGIFVMLMHFSPFQRHARENNGISTAVSLAVYKKLLREPELLPEGTRVCFVSFGGENSAHAGSRAFAAAHPEIKGAKALVIGDIEGGKFSLLRRDALRKTEFSASSSALFDAVEKTGVPCLLPPGDGISDKMNALHGFAANALAEAGCECAFFAAKDYGGNEGDFRKEDAGKLYDIALNTIVNMTAKKEEETYGEED